MSKRKKKKVKKLIKERTDFKNGSKYSLLARYGIVEVEKAIDAIKYRTGEDIVDIKLINIASETACLLLDSNGRAYDVNDDIAERHARYMIVPIGYYDKNKREALYASFLKTPMGWSGVYIGTAYQLVKRSVEFHKKFNTLEDEKYINMFNIPLQLRGYGLTEIMKNLKEDMAELVNESEYNCITNETSIEVDKATDENITTFVNSNEGIKEITLEAYKARLELYDEIYDRLLIKENWRVSNKNRLGFYIKSLFEKIAIEQRHSTDIKGNGYVLSNDRTKCLVNIGLLDKYNNDIYLVDKTNAERAFKFKELTIISSKSGLIELGFDKEDIMEMPQPIKFYVDKRDLIFDGGIEEFDLEDDYRLNHIIHERRGRFPIEYKDVASDIIADKIKSAIYRAIKMSSRDFKYVIPMFNLRYNRIQYLIPFHLDKQLCETPELTIVIGQHNGFWTVYTILETDDAYDNARLLCRPDNTWLGILKANEELIVNTSIDEQNTEENEVNTIEESVEVGV